MADKTNHNALRRIRLIAESARVRANQAIAALAAIAETPPGSAAWGSIGGTLSEQTDLQGALSGKETAGAAVAAVAGHNSAFDHESFVADDDPRLEDQREPTTHGNLHHDPAFLDLDHALDIKLDELAAPTDVTTLNASLSAHGLLPKLGGGTANFLRADGAWAPPAGGGGGTIQLDLHAEADAAATWTNMPSAVTFLFGSHRHVHRVDLSGCTQCRLVVNKQATAGAAASKLILRYRTAFSTTAGDYSNIGTSEVSVAVNVQNNCIASSWVNLAAGAIADVYVAVVGSGGDGALDPQFGNISAQFR